MTHVRKPRPNAVTLPQRFKEAGYLSVSYGKIYHNLLDDNASWTPPSDFMHDHTQAEYLHTSSPIPRSGFRR
eukprot:2287865-Pleurochrysis_carterae.AAC.1